MREWWEWIIVAGIGALGALIVRVAPVVLALLTGRAVSRRQDVDQVLRAHEAFERSLQRTIDHLRERLDLLENRERLAREERARLVERVDDLENGGPASSGG